MKTFTFEKITNEQIRDYALASGDTNRIHLEDEFAKASGLPGIIAHGMLSMGLGGRALFEWGVDMKALKSYQAKFKEKVLPGDELTAELVSETDMGDLKKLEVRLVNQSKVEVMTGVAMVRKA